MKNKIFNLFRWIGKNKIFSLLFFLNFFLLFLLLVELLDVLITKDMLGRGLDHPVGGCYGDFYPYIKHLLFITLIPISILFVSGCLYFKKHKILAYILLLPIGGVVFWSLLTFFFYELFAINLMFFLHF